MSSCLFILYDNFHFAVYRHSTEWVSSSDKNSRLKREETKGNRNNKELEKKGLNLGYKDRMGRRKGDSYSCERIKRENKNKREGSLQQPRASPR